MAKITLKLTNQQVNELAGAISAMNGYERIVKDGEKERAVADTYKHIGVGLKSSMAKNLVALKAPAAAYELARQAIFRECSGGADSIDTKTDEGQQQMRRLNTLLAELATQTHDVDLLTLKLEELRLDVNPWPVTVLAGLGPILEDFREEEGDKAPPRDPTPAERAAEKEIASAERARHDEKLAEAMAAKPNGKGKRGQAAA